LVTDIPIAYATGGTFTLTYKSSTTSALDWDITDGDLTTAVNSLADVIADGFTVTAGNKLSSAQQRYIELACCVTPPDTFRAEHSSITPCTAQSVHLYHPGRTNTQYLVIAQPLINPAHGLDHSQSIAFLDLDAEAVNPVFQFMPAAWDVIDSNTIEVRTQLFNTDDELKVMSLHAGLTSGTFRVPCRIVSNFYLPGVTPGITTPADIPIPERSGIDAIVSALLAGQTGSVVYDV